MKQNVKSSSWKRNFLVIVSGQAVSLVGSSAVQFALIWWLASETGSPLTMALSGLFAFLPQLFLGPFAGVWVDRLRRKHVMIGADMFVGLVAVFYALSFVFVQPPYWSAFVVLGLRAVGSVFHAPAMQAAVPMLVPPEELVRANGWSQFIQSGSFMLGPVLGAAMYAALPLPVILLTDFLGALAASLAVAAVKIPDPERQLQNAPHFFREMKEGVLVFLQDKKLSIVTVASAICMVFYMPMSSFYPLMTSDYFRAGAWHASLVEFLYAGGMMLCALIVSRMGTIKNKFLVVHMGLYGLGLTSLVCGILPANLSLFWVFAVSCGLMGASGNLYNIPYVAYMQETIPPEAQGRAFSVLGSLMSLTMPLGLLIAGPVAEAKGVSLWFFIAGVAFLLVTTASLLLTVRPEKRGGEPGGGPG